jgi:hypothetical protein
VDHGAAHRIRTGSAKLMTVVRQKCTAIRSRGVLWGSAQLWIPDWDCERARDADPSAKQSMADQGSKAITSGHGMKGGRGNNRGDGGGYSTRV